MHLGVGPARAALPPADPRAARSGPRRSAGRTSAAGRPRVIAPRFSRSDCSRLGSANPNRGGRLCLSRFDCTRYISPAANATQVLTAPASRNRPCTVPQNAVAPPQWLQSACRGANGPRRPPGPAPAAARTRPTATGLGERTIRYSPISATIHDSTSSDSNAVVTGTWCCDPGAGSPGRPSAPASPAAVSADGQVPARRAADHEPGQLARQRQAVRARETKDAQPLQHGADALRDAPPQPGLHSRRPAPNPRDSHRG